MRELERNAAHNRSRMPAAAGTRRIGIVGRGRLGHALAAGLREAGLEVDGPLGRAEAPTGEAIVLCVPDREIALAARAVAGGGAAYVGHTSGATPLSALEPARAAGASVFGLHPLQTFAAEDRTPPLEHFAGAGCAVAGSTPDAVRLATDIARTLGMEPFALDDEGRAAYHAAASIASNFLLTLQAAAESVAAAAGLEAADARRLLAPLVRTTVETWCERGPVAALTGPVARGDEATVAAQREAVERSEPDLLPLFDALVERTRALAASGERPLAGSQARSLARVGGAPA